MRMDRERFPPIPEKTIKRRLHDSGDALDKLNASELMRQIEK
jgi:hypothetical protein